MKEAFYFSHDYHARSDEKILRIRAKYGAKGYGIYWMLVEIMAEGSAPHILLSDISAIAVSINESAEWLQEFVDFCIDDAKLFLCDGQEFTAKRIVKHKIFREGFKISGLEGAKKRWGELSHPISHPISHPNAKEKKVNNKRVLSPQEFILSLKTNDAYKHIDLDTELLKMDTWLKIHPGRKKTPRFVLNWLNKIEKPIDSLIEKKVERGDAWKYEAPK